MLRQYPGLYLIKNYPRNLSSLCDYVGCGFSDEEDASFVFGSSIMVDFGSVYEAFM